MRITQAEIAELAEVSQATVSRVLSGDSRVEAEVRDRIMAVAQDHNYRPDVRARSLRQQKTHLIGLVLRRTPGSLRSDSFFSELIAEIVGCLAATPYHLCLEITDGTDQQHVYEELLRSRRVDGLILVESRPQDERVVRLLNEGFPFVIIGKSEGKAKVHSINNNNVEAARLATEHLIEQGFRSIAMLAGPSDLSVTQDRVAGYLAALSAHQIHGEVHHTGFGLDEAYTASLKMLCRPDRPDAIVAMDDQLAMGVMRCAHELRITCPQELGLVGFNDSAICDLIEGGLTSVNLQISSMVRWAVRRLLNVIEGETVEGETNHLMPCRLVVRGSSTRLPSAEVL